MKSFSEKYATYSVFGLLIALALLGINMILPETWLRGYPWAPFRFISVVAAGPLTPLAIHAWLRAEKDVRKRLLPYLLVGLLLMIPIFVVGIMQFNDFKEEQQAMEAS